MRVPLVCLLLVFAVVFFSALVDGLQETSQAGPVRLPLQRKLVQGSSKRATTENEPVSDVFYVYYVTIGLGTPPQYFTVQLDSGSADLGVPLKGCLGPCASSQYDPTKSSSSAPKTCTSGGTTSCPNCYNGICEYTNFYASGAGYTAKIYTDTFTLGSLSTTVQFGAITNISEPNNAVLEPAGVDGIAGISFQALSHVDAPTFIDVLYANGIISANIFTLCVTSTGGLLTLGGEEPNLAGTYGYIPMSSGSLGLPYYYSPNVLDVQVNGVSLGISTSYYNPAVLDSGTNSILLLSTAYSQLKQAFLNLCSQENLQGICGISTSKTLFDNYCYSMTPSQLAAFPNIEFVMGDSTQQATLSVPPDVYLIQGACSINPQLYSLNIAPSSTTILGSPTMNGYSVVFDRQSDRLGFVRSSNCTVYSGSAGDGADGNATGGSSTGGSDGSGNVLVSPLKSFLTALGRW